MDWRLAGLATSDARRFLLGAMPIAKIFDHINRSPPFEP